MRTGDLARMVEPAERFMAENHIAESAQSVTIPVRLVHMCPAMKAWSAKASAKSRCG